ncbi:hypothetical protein ANN_24091 [Periplaneta americana]|uniref:Uncharacterized protein n=1 Tax=Periplaneta americana TaxID=6978 RepID=A0ABQ8S2G2_PERAM|nr:hypothetical protein ANN_24091 [Periplaneta americana]
MKALGGMEVEPHAFHDLGTRMRWCDRHHALTAFYSRERPGTQFYRRLSEPRGRSKSLATRKNPVTTWDRTPDLPVRSQLLYQLSYPAQRPIENIEILRLRVEEECQQTQQTLEYGKEEDSHDVAVLATTHGECTPMKRRDMGFQHNKLHLRRAVNRQRGPVAWPARSPDLTLLDFFLWGHVKSMVYTTSVDTRENYENTRCLCSTSPEAPHVGVCLRSMLGRYHKCNAVQSGHFERVL